MHMMRVRTQKLMTGRSSPCMSTEVAPIGASAGALPGDLTEPAPEAGMMDPQRYVAATEESDGQYTDILIFRRLLASGSRMPFPSKTMQYTG